MPPTLHEMGLDRLSVEDRIALAQALWDSVALDVEQEPLTEAQKAELERRIAAADANPTAGVPWEVVRAEAQGEVGAVSLPIILSPEARAEFDEAYDWYEGRAAGLGEAFAEQVQRVFDRIAAMPRLHAAVLRNVRKAVVTRFPYCVYYREETSCVRVLSVFHTSRDPRIWQGRA